MDHQPNVALIDDDDIFQLITTRTIERANLAKNINQFYTGNHALQFLMDHAHNHDELPDIILLILIAGY